ncbi:unnamed protein product [Caenorhabditis sp. 36 PRJEB53466]|nr:unnamed protein product [Caenorhabditis sp. 36 PRJEB53466]
MEGVVHKKERYNGLQARRDRRELREKMCELAKLVPNPSGEKMTELTVMMGAVNLLTGRAPPGKYVLEGASVQEKNNFRRELERKEVDKLRDIIREKGVTVRFLKKLDVLSLTIQCIRMNGNKDTPPANNQGLNMLPPLPIIPIIPMIDPNWLKLLELLYLAQQMQQMQMNSEQNGTDLETDGPQ